MDKFDRQYLLYSAKLIALGFCAGCAIVTAMAVWLIGKPRIGLPCAWGNGREQHDGRGNC